MKIAAAIALLLVAAFCLFGFLASFEPGPGHGWFKLFYAVAGLSCGLAAVALFMRPSRPAG